VASPVLSFVEATCGRGIRRIVDPENWTAG
jgi:hypothetical protein